MVEHLHQCRHGRGEEARGMANSCPHRTLPSKVLRTMAGEEENDGRKKSDELERSSKEVDPRKNQHPHQSIAENLSLC